MNARAARTITRVLGLLANLAGLAASAVLLVDYLRPAAVFCGEVGSGCTQLRATSLASWAGIPTPVLGLLGFAVLGGIGLFEGRRPRLVHLAIAASAATFAAFLISVQARMGVFCRFCMVADVSALVLFGAALARWQVDGPEIAVPSAQWQKPVFGVSMALAMGAPIAIGYALPAPPRLGSVAAGVDAGPEPLWPLVEREIRTTRASALASGTETVTIVDFVDFECPFCRMTHEALSPLLAKYQGRVRLVRKQVPLRSIHPHALDAARAACCGEKLGQGTPMAEALFVAPVAELTPEGCERIASRIGIDPAAFRACVADPATSARVDAETAEFKSSGGRGLPTIWIDETKFIGQTDAESLEEAIVKALHRKG